jgi:hypothetical protein
MGLDPGGIHQGRDVAGSLDADSTGKGPENQNGKSGKCAHGSLLLGSS